MKKDFEKKTAALWRKIERREGNRIPDNLREKCEQVFGLNEDVEALPDFEGFLGDYLSLLKYAATVGYFSNRKKPKDSASGKRYQRCFEKRLYIVEFVMERRPHNIRAKTFRDYMWGSRFNWKLVCDDWNKENPHDYYMSPEVLKVRFYRAIADENIQREYYKREYHHDIAGVLGYEYDDILERLSKSQYNLLALPSDLSDSTSASLPKELIRTIEAWREAHPSTAEWQQIETTGGSKALIALNKVWYQGGTLTPDEEILLKQLHDKYPFGQTDFTIWLKQTLKQIFEKSVEERTMVDCDQLRNPGRKEGKK